MIDLHCVRLYDVNDKVNSLNEGKYAMNMILKYYRRFISDIKKVALDEERRMQIQFRYMLKILLVVVVLSGTINLLTERYTMGFLLYLLGLIYFIFYMIVYKLKTKGVKIVTWLMILSSLGICINVIVHGTTDGMAPLWILLFPILSFLLIGQKKGMISSLVLLGIIIFFYWTPIGRAMHLHDYDTIFMQRYPIVYLMMLIVAIFYETLRSTMVEEINRQKKKMESVYKNQYHSMEGRIAEAKKIRHDLRHHFVMISQLIKNDQIEEAQKYIDRYYNALPFEEALTYCEHYATNALMTYYGQIAKDNDIPVEVNLNFPAKVNISTQDLTVVFGNLLENAVHACVNGQKESSSFKPWITIQGNYDGSVLTFALKNASLHEAKQNEAGQYISTKHEGTGIGVNSIREVVEKYDGVCLIEQSEGVYSTSIVMYAKS